MIKSLSTGSRDVDLADRCPDLCSLPWAEQGGASKAGGAAAVPEDAAAPGGRPGQDGGGVGQGPRPLLPGELCPVPAAAPAAAGRPQAAPDRPGPLRQSRRHQLHEGETRVHLTTLKVSVSIDHVNELNAWYVCLQYLAEELMAVTLLGKIHLVYSLWCNRTKTQAHCYPKYSCLTFPT